MHCYLPARMIFLTSTPRPRLSGITLRCTIYIVSQKALVRRSSSCPGEGGLETSPVLTACLFHSTPSSYHPFTFQKMVCILILISGSASEETQTKGITDGYHTHTHTQHTHTTQHTQHKTHTTHTYNTTHTPHTHHTPQHTHHTHNTHTTQHTLRLETPFAS